MINTILIGSGLIHPGPWARWQVQRVLATLTGTQITRRATLDAVTAEDYAQSQLIVTYFQEQQLSEQAWIRLRDFVASGGAMLVFHAGTASFKTFDPWFDLIGGRFTGHGPIQRITVTPQAQSTLLGDMDSFQVTEELYHHEMHGDVDVHATVSDEAGTHPVVWTKAHDRGRIAYIVFGHRASAFMNSGVQQITKAMLSWLMEEHNA